MTCHSGPSSHPEGSDLHGCTCSMAELIITSRPKVDIQHFFDAPNTQSVHLRYDLVKDEKATADLEIFARHQFDWVASKWHLKSPWPEESLFNGVISWAV